MNIPNVHRTISEVMEAYVKELGLYLLAHRERRFVEGNKHASRAIAAAAALRHEFGAEGRAAMLSLLTHPDSGIRLSVAADVIDFAEDMATTVLKDIERANRPFEGTAAHYCLREWREGRKKLPGGPVAPKGPDSN